MKKNILIIEDDFDTQLLFSEILREEGYNVVAQNDGRAAIAYLKVNHAPSLIFMDLSFPNGTPEEFVKELRVLPGVQHTPLVIVSGNSDIEDYSKLLGATNYLKKPFEIEALLRIMDRII